MEKIIPGPKWKTATVVGLLLLILPCCNPAANNEKDGISRDPNGIGPLKTLQLGPINDSLMKVGQERFKSQCSTCHTMEFKNSGPDISDLLATRKPEWFMNFMLNKNEMLQRDSLTLLTLRKYPDPCGANPQSEQEAYELLEYLRIYQIWLHEFNVK